jgi:hypothetical protein
MLVPEFPPQKQEKTLLPSDDHPYQDGAKLYIILAFKKFKKLPSVSSIY